jgi:hypothetical protein
MPAVSFVCNDFVLSSQVSSFDADTQIPPDKSATKFTSVSNSSLTSLLHTFDLLGVGELSPDI